MSKENQKWGFWKFTRESLKFWRFVDITNPFALIRAYRRYKKIEK